MNATLAGAQLLGAISSSNLLQHIEQIKRLVWLIDTGAAKLLLERYDGDTHVTVIFQDSSGVYGKGPDLLMAFKQMLQAARHQEGPLA